jgi:isopenicillin N synthase-like dioxygenase
MAPVPTVDLEPFRLGTAPDRAGVALEVRRACEEIGFLTIVGHGIAPDVVASTYETSRRFFDLPEVEKGHLAAAGHELVPGRPVYRPLGGERLGATLGSGAQADLKESLDWGPDLPGVGWPREPVGLRPAWEAYYGAMSQVADLLDRAFALALELPENAFLPFFDERSSSVRVINYPAPEVEQEAGRLRAGAHRDYGCLTILRIDETPGGLQVQLPDGEWVDVAPAADAFVVNLGDLMARWTNERWVSTLHRVAWPPSDARSESRRQSLVFFHNPRAGAVIDAIPAVGGRPKYGPVVAGDYILAKANAAFTPREAPRVGDGR